MDRRPLYLLKEGEGGGDYFDLLRTTDSLVLRAPPAAAKGHTCVTLVLEMTGMYTAKLTSKI